ncbi:50S ribosomal protein L16 [Patescibacteria group bacterium]|nr:50S ribosomal protein L16 [Patescibacteria group bacterium]MBU4512668.1 50S ribosomal protein L16 [Patescibacteria group bacterium]MCG2693572.1 50S ribosomal protein L16 [Candidatus Parcubacteria bacterium]
MLAPKKVKHRKWHKQAGGSGQAKKASATNKISFGSFGMVATTAKWITARQIEAARRVITRKLQKGGKIWIRIFPDKPVTIKGNEIPMGGGKGAVDHYVVSIKPGNVLFEIDGVEEELAREAIVLAGHKLPVAVKFIKK